MIQNCYPDELIVNQLNSQTLKHNPGGQSGSTCLSVKHTNDNNSATQFLTLNDLIELTMLNTFMSHEVHISTPLVSNKDFIV